MSKFKSAESLLVNQYDKVVFSLWGSTGIGKTFFALTCPPPVYILNFEPEGMRGALHGIKKTGLGNIEETFVIDVLRDVFGDRVPTQLNQVQRVKLYNYVHTVAKEIFNEREEFPIGEKGTIVIDTMTTLWKLMQKTTMDEIIQLRKKQDREVFGFDRGIANLALEQYIKGLTTSNLNIVFLSNAQSVWAKGAPTNQITYNGSDRLTTWVDIHGQLTGNRYNRATGDLISSAKFTIEKCRMDRDLIGEIVEEPTYDTVMETIQLLAE